MPRGIWPGALLALCGVCSSALPADPVDEQLSALVRGDGPAERALAGLAVAVYRGGRPIYANAFGAARLAPDDQVLEPLRPDSLIRVASVSKTLSALVVMELVGEGALSLDEDVSRYLGWPLRNPNYPAQPITLRQLLSHISSIRDAGESYILRYPKTLQDAFDPAAPEWPQRFQSGYPPGGGYEYANLNYGVVATVLERVTGQRFDELMGERFFDAHGIDGGFNVADFSAEQQQRVATLYRKRNADDVWDSAGPWYPQVDDPADGFPTALPADADYVPGTNGAQFSPQGGARLSLEGLGKLAQLYRNPAFDEPDWLRSETSPAGEDAWTCAYAGGLQQLRTDCGAQLTPGEERHWRGHSGEAYGLLSGVWLDADSGDALVFAITGTSFDPYTEPRGKTGFLRIEEDVVEILLPLLRAPAAP